MKLLNRPDNGILIGQVGDVADGALEGGTVDIGGHGNDDLDIVGDTPGLELGPGLDHILDPRALVGLNHRLDPDERLDVGVETVGHEVELSVGRDEADGAVVLEAGQPHTLMELDVLHLDGLVATAAPGLVGPARGLENEFVVEPELELGHAGEKGPHLDGAVDLAVQHGAIGRHEEVELLDDIEEDFVLLVLDALRPPADGVGEGHGGFGLEVLRHAIALLRDEGAEDGGVERLGHAVVHRLVQQFVDAYKVVAYGFFLQRSEVVFEHGGWEVLQLEMVLRL